MGKKCIYFLNFCFRLEEYNIYIILYRRKNELICLTWGSKELLKLSNKTRNKMSSLPLTFLLTSLILLLIAPNSALLLSNFLLLSSTEISWRAYIYKYKSKSDWEFLKSHAQRKNFNSTNIAKYIPLLIHLFFCTNYYLRDFLVYFFQLLTV